MRARGAWSPEEVEVLIDMLDDLKQGWLAAAELYYVVLDLNTPGEQVMRIMDITGTQLVEKMAQGTSVIVQAGPSRVHLSYALEWLAWEHFNPGLGWDRYVQSVGLGKHRIAEYQAERISEEPEKYEDFVAWKRQK